MGLTGVRWRCGVGEDGWDGNLNTREGIHLIDRYLGGLAEATASQSIL
jgi:hypothetical protein